MLNGPTTDLLLVMSDSEAGELTIFHFSFLICHCYDFLCISASLRLRVFATLRLDPNGK